MESSPKGLGALPAILSTVRADVIVAGENLSDELADGMRRLPQLSMPSQAFAGIAGRVAALPCIGQACAAAAWFKPDDDTLFAMCRSASFQSDRTWKRILASHQLRSFMALRRCSRVARAWDLLDNSMLGLGLIVDRVGFGTERALVKSFRALLGLPPKRARASFSDFQCPFCRALHESIQAVRAEFGEEIVVTYLHYPLSYHREATPAALASECASKVGRFEQFADAIFASQDSLGLLSWEALAGRSGIPAIVPFMHCVNAMKDHPRISSGRQLGKSLGVTGTPTVLVNGWLLPVVPSRDELRRMVRELLSGKTLPLVLS